MKKIACCFFTLFCMHTYADPIKVTLYSTTNNEPMGAITFEDSPYGLLIKPELQNLKPGNHGMHFHSHLSCAHEGNDAGSHFDPQGTNTHKGPYANGHLGDLPLLYVNDEGLATTQTLAPRLKTTDIKGLALIIHEKGDNYSDIPPLGGGGARIGCGLIPQDNNE